MAEVVNQVAYGHKRYTLTRRGNELVVLISFEEWQSIEKALQEREDERDIRDAEAAMKRIKKDGGISLEQVKNDLDL